MVFSWVLIAAFKKSLVKINIENKYRRLAKKQAVVSKKSGFWGLVGSFKGESCFKISPIPLRVL
ncbi:hypothetical protein HMPREF1397_01710 [Helicobacter pylori GAM115Ai]|nr:hypothetical protein HMPREF1397_01710 [Helicobacter pylori GAM115Ai]